jgi:hypothetical protein
MYQITAVHQLSSESEGKNTRAIFNISWICKSRFPVHLTLYSRNKQLLAAVGTSEHFIYSAKIKHLYMVLNSKTGYKDPRYTLIKNYTRQRKK